MSAETTPEPMAYVGHCPRCDMIYAAAVDGRKDKRDTAKFVAGLVRDGARVERITCAAVRAATWCDCYKKARARKKAQAELFSPTPHTERDA